MGKRKKNRSKQPSQVPPLDYRHYAAIDLMVGPHYDSKAGRSRWLTRGEIANIVGVSRMQLWRWEQRKDFQREKDKRLRAYLRSIVPKRKSYAELAIGGDAQAFAKLMGIIQG